MRFKRERKRTRKEIEGLVYYAFGGQCYHRARQCLTVAETIQRTLGGSRTACGHVIDHTDPDPQRVWRAAPEAYIRHDYRPCPLCYGRNYVFKPE